MDYEKFLQRAATKRAEVARLLRSGLSVVAVARQLKISRQRVYQIRANGNHRRTK